MNAPIDSPVKISDAPEYRAFISECVVLLACRNRLIRKQRAEKPCHDEHTAYIKSMRRITPLAQALYALLPGDTGFRLARKGQRSIYLNSAGQVWMGGELIGNEV